VNTIFGRTSSPQLPAEQPKGQSVSVEVLMEMVYPELRRVARAMMLGERAPHTLQPTALVHEAVIRILGLRDVTIQSTEHFYSLVVGQMRRILTDHARRKLALKRAGTVPCDVALLRGLGQIDVEQVVLVDEVLDRLANVDSRAHRVVTLRFFGGLSSEEIAAVLGLSPVTVHRDWEFARLWLFGELR
jgi:RNA polymerase sigma factor (TIGR02999 family)